MLTQICEVFKEAYRRGWITSRDGNASYRRSQDNFFYVTPSGVRKQQLMEEMFIKMDIDESGVYRDKWFNKEGEHIKQQLSRNLRPSGELPMHWRLQRFTKAFDGESRVVLHLHPTHVIAAISAGFNLPNLCNLYPEIYRYTRVATEIEFIEPISEALGLSVEKALLDNDGELKADIVGMKAHGTVSVGGDPWEVLEHVERLNHICEIALLAKAAS